MKWFTLALVLVFSVVARAGETLNEWQQDDALIVTNTPTDFDTSKPTLLIIYLLPNGSTIEMTMGAKLEPGMPWQYDIQHIAAQTRKLRQIDHDRNIVVAYVEAQAKAYKLTWPTWRKEKGDAGGKLIRGIVERIVKSVPAKDVKVDLIAHSGGGSFIFGYLNAEKAIGDNIERISWIDANYGYDEADGHGAKLLAWLKGDANRHLVVFAYNDRAATLNGKPFVSETGGTFYRSHKMVEFFEKNGGLDRKDHEPFEDYVGMKGQIHLMLHTNPEKKILHTVLVERNGLLEAVTWDTPMHEKWGGAFWGPRAYADLIEPAVLLKTPRPKKTTTAATTAPTTSSTKAQATAIPERAAGAMGGKMFADTIADLPPKAREAAIVAEVLKGNIPDFQRKFVEVSAKSGEHSIVYRVIPDYLAIGDDKDFVRMPMTPGSAKQIADSFGCVLPTRKMVDDIYKAAAVKVEPKPLTEQREAVRSFVAHDAIVSGQLTGKPLGQLVAGDKKDIVVSNRLKEKPNRVAIYGWHKLDGKAIQPLYVGHGDFYADYSHGVRLVLDACIVDGKPARISVVMKDPELSKLVSDEGVIDGGY